MIRKVGCVSMLVVRAFVRDSMHAGNPLGTASRSASHDVRCLPPCMDTTCAGRSAAPALVGVDGGVRRGRAQGCMLAQLQCRDGCGGRGLIPVPQANRPGGLLHVCACPASACHCAHAKTVWMHSRGHACATAPCTARRLAQFQDVAHAFSNHSWLQSPEGQSAMRRVLAAFSVHAPGVGYTR